MYRRRLAIHLQKKLGPLGVFHNAREDESKVDIAMGPPNHQLRATSQEREAEIIKQLARAGILFLVECAYNIARPLASRAGCISRQEAPFDRVKPLMESICRDKLQKFLAGARTANKTPAKLVRSEGEDVVYLVVSFSESLRKGGTHVS